MCHHVMFPSAGLPRAHFTARLRGRLQQKQKQEATADAQLAEFGFERHFILFGATCKIIETRRFSNILILVSHVMCYLICLIDV